MRVFVIFCMLVTLLTACGRRVPPLPPEAVRPMPPQDLRLSLGPKGATVCFKLPRLKIDGHPLPGLKGVRVKRVCKGQDLRKGPCAKTFFLRLPAKSWQTGRFCFTDKDLPQGREIHYIIQVVRGWRCASDPVASPSFVWHVPPAAPVRLVARGGDAKVCLRWPPVKEFLDGTPLSPQALFYRIYRFQGDRVVLLPKRVKNTHFCDEGLANQKTYCYRVQAVFSYQGTLLPGPKSPKACAFTRDLTPPRPPEGLTAVPIKGGVLLRWFRSGALDLAGYRVYRKRPGEPPRLLTPKLLKEPKYVDRHLPGPGLYYYWVTAVDSSPQANESAPSERVEVEITPEEAP